MPPLGCGRGPAPRGKEPATGATSHKLATRALSFSRLRRQLPPQGALRYARYAVFSSPAQILRSHKCSLKNDSRVDANA